MKTSPSFLRPTLIAGASVLVLGLAACGPRDTVANNPTTRAIDRGAQTDMSGAYPSQRDGTAANPKGTAAGRAFDRAAGTNTSGAYPAQSDGTPENPKGTAIGRAIDKTTD